jgi:hypothetical protein
VEHKDVFREIEVECFSYFRRQRRRKDAPTWSGAHVIGVYGSRERIRGRDKAYGLLWAAFESLSELGPPEFWTPVELDGEIGLLVVIDGAATLTTFGHENAITRHVGPLEGGTYVERFFYERQVLAFRGEFNHERLPSPLTIAATGPDEHEVQKARDRFREWAEARKPPGEPLAVDRRAELPSLPVLPRRDANERSSG